MSKIDPSSYLPHPTYSISTGNTNPSFQLTSECYIVFILIQFLEKQLAYPLKIYNSMVFRILRIGKTSAPTWEHCITSKPNSATLPSPQPQQPPNPMFPSRGVSRNCLIWALHINGIAQYEMQSLWLTSSTKHDLFQVHSMLKQIFECVCVWGG